MSFLFGEPKLNPNELRECLDWLCEHYKLTVFQDKEAELYNNAVLRDSDSMTTSPSAANRLLKAARRLVQAATELSVRYEKTEPLPEAVMLDHYGWGLVFTQYKAWAVAQCAAIEAIAIGSNPRIEYVQDLLQDCSKLESKAKKEEEKLLKRMMRSGVTLSDLQKLMNKANQFIAEDNWQPSSG